MKGFKIIPPKQKYMTISEIHEAFGSRGVVAYSCRIIDSVLEGGVVIAVQDAADVGISEIKAYQRQLRQKNPDKSPIIYLRVEKDAKMQRLLLTYDGGGGEKKVTPKLEVKKSAAEEAILSVPVSLLAQALSINGSADSNE